MEARVPWLGDYVFVNGNEIAAILTRYRLESLQRFNKLPSRPFVLKTQVTTELMARIAKTFGASVIGDLLVGFKYVGDVIDHLEREGSFGNVEARPSDFIIAAEKKAMACWSRPRFATRMPPAPRSSSLSWRLS